MYVWFFSAYFRALFPVEGLGIVDDFGLNLIRCKVVKAKDLYQVFVYVRKASLANHSANGAVSDLNGVVPKACSFVARVVGSQGRSLVGNYGSDAYRVANVYQYAGLVGSRARDFLFLSRARRHFCGVVPGDKVGPYNASGRYFFTVLRYVHFANRLNLTMGEVKAEGVPLVVEGVFHTVRRVVH